MKFIINDLKYDTDKMEKNCKCKEMVPNKQCTAQGCI